MMRLAWLWCLVLLAAVALAKTPDGFLTTWPEVQKAAQAEHKLIYLHFTTTWCGWCRKIEDETYPDPDVKKALSECVAASLDCTVGKTGLVEPQKTNLNLFRKFGGRGYPYLVILDEDGETVYRTISGYVPPKSFLNELAAAKATRKEYQDFQVYAKTADQQSYDYALRAMRMFAKLQRKEQADAMARRVLTLDPKNAHGNNLDASWTGLQQVPPERWETDGLTYLDNIKRLDADNAQGTREQAMWQYALGFYSRRNFAKCIATLQELIDTGKTLRDPQNAYGLLGVAQVDNGDVVAARASLKKAIAFDPKSRTAQYLQQRLDKLGTATPAPAVKP